MIGQDPGLDILFTIARRQRLLSLLTEQPWQKRDLAEELSLSRSTIDRSVRKLESLSLVERDCNGYQLTRAGELLFTEFQATVDIAASVVEVSDSLSGLPQDAPLSAALLQGATVSEPKPHAPTDQFERIEERILDADWYRGIAVVDVNSRFRHRFIDRVQTGKFDAEVVFTETLFSYLCETDPDWVTEITTSDCPVYTIPSVPYGLALIETAVYLVIFTETGDVAVLIENDSPEAVEWARSAYRTVRNGAEEVSSPPK